MTVPFAFLFRVCNTPAIQPDAEVDFLRITAAAGPFISQPSAVLWKLLVIQSKWQAHLACPATVQGIEGCSKDNALMAAPSKGPADLQDCLFVKQKASNRDERTADHRIHVCGCPSCCASHLRGQQPMMLSNSTLHRPPAHGPCRCILPRCPFCSTLSLARQASRRGASNSRC